MARQRSPDRDKVFGLVT
ncbi:Protein of unknown function [Bacillus wiedmannii]|uniref:Uncharacterized protein n=1 Tax=Bacillus wiedmannii TaxID=1890302 RepID=A0A1C6X2X0_9BACI|nr:hypothetical protein DT250_30650 [Bacillus sp. AR2-1]MBJ8108372.1 hypothetical protein [Bacillus cereus group sp. N6]QWH69340.1 hypothetical protein EXW41_12830 [Bacillus wiedmannii]TKH26817.1 hypothetical protein FC697_02160 [Bacillus wiedmannii]SCC31450.1 Protein of unknown function [Bacillus wiedmannii]